MTLNEAIQQTITEVLRSKARWTTDQMAARVLDLNGVASEFEEQALRRAQGSLKAQIRREMERAADEPADPQQFSLFGLLPGEPVRKAISVSTEDGDVAFISFAAATQPDHDEHDQLLTGNIDRAVSRRHDFRLKDEAIRPYREFPTTTNIEALEAMARAQQKAA